jgi:hypothetical protein
VQPKGKATTAAGVGKQGASPDLREEQGEADGSDEMDLDESVEVRICRYAESYCC